MIVNRIGGQLKTARSFGRWAHLQEPPRDPVFGFQEKLDSISDPRSVDLTMDSFRDEEGKPQIFPSIKKAIGVVHQQRRDLEYHMSPAGDRRFLEVALSLAYGKQSQSLKEQRIASVQTVSGSGGYHLLMSFLRRFSPEHKHNLVLHTTTPSRPINDSLFAYNGAKHARLPYYDSATHSLDMQGLLDGLQRIPEGSIVLLHGCSHNPTGVDPSPQQWRAISDVFVRKRHFAFFDMAYQGCVSGDLLRDGHCLRLWEESGLEFCVSQSFSHNMGLYGETVGVLSLVCENSAQASAVVSNVGNVCARHSYGTPPRLGSEIVKSLVSDQSLLDEWHRDLASMACRSNEQREKFVSLLAENSSTDRWKHLLGQVGKFSYLSLTPEQLQQLRDKHQVYLKPNGQLALSGLTRKNMSTVANSINAVVGRTGL